GARRERPESRRLQRSPERAAVRPDGVPAPRRAAGNSILREAAVPPRRAVRAPAAAEPRLGPGPRPAVPDPAADQRPAAPAAPEGAPGRLDRLPLEAQPGGAAAGAGEWPKREGGLEVRRSDGVGRPGRQEEGGDAGPRGRGGVA